MRPVLRPVASPVLALLALLPLGLTETASGDAGPASPRVADLAWMAGSWGGTANGVTSEEHWTSAGGDGLVGMHKDVKAGKMTGFEFLRIEVDAAQRICYVSMPGGAPPTSFCAIEVGPRRVVFENREHDFPQRILYWLDADGRLHARIEGPTGGGEKALEWTWSRLSG